MEYTSELIIGKHSIEAALNNPARVIKAIYCTSESKKLFSNKILEKHKINILNKEEFLKTTQKIYQQNGFEYKRIPSDFLIEVGPKSIHEMDWLQENLKN
jgi:hypothetical protein